MVKFQGRPQLLPDSLIKNLPEIVRREILHPKVNDREFGMPERQKASARIVNMFQMKFEDSNSQELAMGEFGTFLRDYALTADEILEAYRMVAKLELVDFQGEPIVFYPNLSIGQAGKILKAYQDHKIESVQHTKGTNQIKAFLNPPAPEKTPKEKKEIRVSLLKVEFNRLQNEGKILGHHIFYELIKSTGIETVKLSFLEVVLDRINLNKNKTGLLNSDGAYAKNRFIESFVKAFFEHHKLKDLSETEFVEYWENIYSNE